jgi:hypothetical protein
MGRWDEDTITKSVFPCLGKSNISRESGTTIRSERNRKSVMTNNFNN